VLTEALRREFFREKAGQSLFFLVLTLAAVSEGAGWA
jgi:hypothetical protein